MDSLPEIQPGDRMDALLDALPGARRALFAAYHVGGCQSCAYRDEETLADVCARNEIAVDDAIATLLESHAHDREMLLAPPELKKLLDDEGERIILVDTRTREEHEAVTLPGAQFMTQDLQQQLLASPPVERIVLFDHRGRDVLDHCAWFRGHGLKQTCGLDGGIDAWAKEIDPTLPRYRLEMES